MNQTKILGAILAAALAATSPAQNLGANPNTASSETLGAKLQEIKALKAGGGLSAGEKAKLDKLWASANKASELNNACREVALNKPLPRECQTLQGVLVEFEDLYLEVTGDLRLSAARVASELNDRREMINRCYDAFPFEMLSPQELFRPEGLLQVEPLEKDSEISWEISLYPTAERKKKIDQYLKKWFELCEPHIMHQTKASFPEFAPLFASKMAKGDPKTGIVLKQDRDALVGFLTKTYTGIYSVNKQDVFKVKLESGYQTFKIGSFKRPLSGYYEGPQVWMAGKGKCGYNFDFKGKKVVSDGELAGGVKTRLDWIETFKKEKPVYPKQDKDGWPIFKGSKPYNCWVEP